MNKLNVEVVDNKSERQLLLRGHSPSWAESPLDARELLRRLWRRKVVLFAAIALAMLANVLYLTQRVPSYTASGLILIGGDPSENIEIVSSADGPVKASDLVYDEIERLRSPRFVTRVVQNLMLDDYSTITTNRSALSRILGWVKDLRDWIISYPPVADTLELFGGSSSEPVPEADAAGGGLNETLEQSIGLRNFLSRLVISPQGFSKVVRVSFTSTNPKDAAMVVNAVIREYIADRKLVRDKAADRASEELKDRVISLQEEIIESEKDIENFRAESGLLEGRSGPLVEQEISDLNEKLFETKVAKSELEAIAREVRESRRIGTSENVNLIADFIDVPLLRSLQDQKRSLEQRIIENSTRYGEQHPTMIVLRSELSDVNRRIDDQLRNLTNRLDIQIEIRREQEAALADRLEDLKAQAAAENTSSVQLRAIERTVEAKRSLLETMLARLAELDAGKGISVGQPEVLSWANIPESPSSPGSVMISVVMALVGLIFGTVMIVVLDSLRKGYVSGGELEVESGIPLLGVLPLLRSGLRAPESPEIIAKKLPFSEYSQLLRTVLTNFRAAGPDVRSILVTSATLDEGKSTTCVSLAQVAAQAGYSVLLIDADVFRPSIHWKTNLRVAPGLVEVLDGTAKFADAVQTDAETGCHVLVAGEVDNSNDPVQFGEKVGSILHALRREYQLIIIDSPPVHMASVALDTARFVDGVCFLVRWRKTEKQLAKLAIKKLNQNNANIVGTILTLVDSRRYRRDAYGDAAYLLREGTEYYQR